MCFHLSQGSGKSRFVSDHMSRRTQPISGDASNFALIEYLHREHGLTLLGFSSMFKVAPVYRLLQNVRAALLDRAIAENLDVVFDQTRLLAVEKLDKKGGVTPFGKLTGVGYKFVAVVVDPPTKKTLFARIEERNRRYSENRQAYKLVALSEAIIDEEMARVERAAAAGEEGVKPSPLVALFEETYTTAEEITKNGTVPDGYAALLVVDGNSGEAVVVSRDVAPRSEEKTAMGVDQ